MSNKDDDINSLSHSKWRCHYHAVFAPKFRRQAIYGKIKTDIGKILRQLCEQKVIEIKDHQKEVTKWIFSSQWLTQHS